MLTIRPYLAEDREACLALFDGNTPRFFNESEREGFVAWLDDQALRLPYLVIVRDDRIVACGGHAVQPDGSSVEMC